MSNEEQAAHVDSPTIDLASVSADTVASTIVVKSQEEIEREVLAAQAESDLRRLVERAKDDPAIVAGIASVADRVEHVAEHLANGDPVLAKRAAAALLDLRCKAEGFRRGWLAVLLILGVFFFGGCASPAADYVRAEAAAWGELDPYLDKWIDASALEQGKKDALHQLNIGRRARVEHAMAGLGK